VKRETSVMTAPQGRERPDMEIPPANIPTNV
jgi:hypothetical protein